MKRYLSLITLALLLAINCQASAQRHRHNPQMTGVSQTTDSTSFEIPTDTTGIVAYSDTTAATIPSSDSVTYHHPAGWDDDWEDNDWKEFREMFGIGVGSSAIAIAAIVFVLLICLAPFILLGFIAWIIIRNRNQRYKLMQQAMQQGQPIPEPLLKDAVQTNDDLWRKAIRNIFLGIGLAVLFALWDSKFLSGLAWVLCFYGIGQAIICKTTKRKEEQSYNAPHPPQSPAQEQQVQQPESPVQDEKRGEDIQENKQ
ncbi:MAG: DUF6249 domain-containing protein [Prevotella sp.]|nr:DUF6249 domain-containing protein [Prevotella sp.]